MVAGVVDGPGARATKILARMAMMTASRLLLRAVGAATTGTATHKERTVAGRMMVAEDTDVTGQTA
jgi:hypothetical protein